MAKKLTGIKMVSSRRSTRLSISPIYIYIYRCVCVSIFNINMYPILEDNRSGSVSNHGPRKALLEAASAASAEAS